MLDDSWLMTRDAWRRTYDSLLILGELQLISVSPRIRVLVFWLITGIPTTWTSSISGIPITQTSSSGNMCFHI